MLRFKIEWILLAWLAGVSGLFRDGFEVVETGPGGFFGAVTDETTGTAWFGVDDSPARIIRVNLNTMQISGKLELRAEEQRMWCFVKHGNYGYVGVESPGGRLVGIDLDKMERLGYATASKYPLLAGTVIQNYGYFSAGSNPSTVMRLHLLQMQQGECKDWSICRFEVSLHQGEEAVRAMFPDAEEQHLFLAMYTVPGRIIKMEIPALNRVSDLELNPGEDKLLCGTRYGELGLFGTATSPGQLIKVNLDSMTRISALTFISGEDRPASLVVYGKYLFVGFGSAWAEGTSSVVKVDVERMVRVSAVVTREGQTWLYTGIGYKSWGFFGTRGTATTKHATIVRLNLDPTFPGVPVPPVFNESGSTWITLNWLREYPEYHNGGAPVIGARVLMRPANHHDWTAEHVYGYAAPDPAAPKDRIVRVHEEPFRLEDHGYVARVDRLLPQTAYKFAVILTNEIGPSHRSRSSDSMKTSLASWMELAWVGAALAGTALLAGIYVASWRAAPRIDVLYGDRDTEEEQVSSLLRSKKVFVPSSAEGPSLGPEAPDEGAYVRVLRRLSGAIAHFLGQAGAARRAAIALGLYAALCSTGLMVEYLFCGFVGAQWPRVAEAERLVYSGAAVAACGACAWCVSAALTAWIGREHDHARRCCVAAGWVLWATEVSTLTVIMAWTSAKLSPDAESAAAVLSAALLLAVALLALLEAVIYALRNPAAQAAEGAAPDEFRGLSNWLTERL